MRLKKEQNILKFLRLEVDTKRFEIITDEHLTKLAESTAEKYPTEHK